METDKILARKEGPLGRLIVNNPEKRNAISMDMAVRAGEVLDEFDKDADIRVVIISGEGEKAFVAGADISEFDKRRKDADTAADYEKTASALFRGVRILTKPTIAMIHGYCMGGGVALACGCDIRICAEGSIFAIPAGRLGLAYRVDLTRWLVDAVGPGRAKEILFTARRFDAEEAYRMGLVNHVVALDELESFVVDFANTIAENAPLTMAAAKGIINEIVRGEGDFDSALCVRLIAACMDSEDFAEGRKAFAEKRKPQFKGR